MRVLLLGRASAALSQSEPWNRTRTSELGGHAITWRWEKECQHGSVARTRSERATAITRRRREETVKIENAVDGAAFLHRSAHGRSRQMSDFLRPGSSDGGQGGLWMEHYLPNRTWDSWIPLHGGLPCCRRYTVLGRLMRSFQRRAVMGASGRVYPRRGKYEALLQHVTFWQQQQTASTSVLSDDRLKLFAEPMNFELYFVLIWNGCLLFSLHSY